MLENRVNMYIEKPTKEEDKKAREYVASLTKGREPWQIGTDEWLKMIADLIK